jgi:formate-dependent nitrite reductase membrane component NrfD
MNTFVADPRWHWWIIWYFYLGGIAAGSYFIASLVELIGDERDRELSRVGYLLAAPLVTICGILLILDLNQPTRFWHMLFDATTLAPHVKYWSPISIGAWALLLFGLISTISCIGAAAEVGVPGLERWAGTASRLHRTVAGRVFDCMGTICGFFIASYTGALLTATNQPVWSDSPWIAPLFLSSSATTGIAALQVASPGRHGELVRSHAKLERADAWVLALEAAMLILFLWSLALPIDVILSGWPFVLLLVVTLGGGVCLPMVLRLWPNFSSSRRAIAASFLVLVGGFVLRYSVLAAAPALLASGRR